MLDSRLSACRSLVCGDFPCDVGTDHGYLIAELGRGIACDINEKPLMAAKATIERAGLSDKIQLILSDGLDNIPPEGITDVIIAGMGGELIFKIISRAEWLKSGVNLVLQPMTRVSRLRVLLCENGYSIIKETAAAEGGHFYTAMQVKYTGECFTPDSFFGEVGRLDPHDPVAAGYILFHANRLKNVAEGKLLADKGSREAAELLSLSRKMEEYVK